MSEPNTPPELNIAADTIFGLIEILHELAGQDRGLERDAADDGSDDASIESLEAGSDDARPGEIGTIIHDLNVDEQIDLVAVAFVGRGDFGLDEWEAARAEARDRVERDGARFVYDFVTADTVSAEYLEAGLEAFGFSFADWDSEEVVARPDAAAGGEEPGDAADDAQRQTPGQAVTSGPGRDR